MSIFIADENGSNRQLKYKVANVYIVYTVQASHFSRRVKILLLLQIISTGDKNRKQKWRPQFQYCIWFAAGFDVVIANWLQDF